MLRWPEGPDPKGGKALPENFDLVRGKTLNQVTVALGVHLLDLLADVDQSDKSADFGGVVTGEGFFEGGLVLGENGAQYLPEVVKCLIK